MSGIAGILYFDGRQADPRSLKKMAASLAHRSVDGSDTWCDGPLGLINCKFATTPEACSRQPLVHAGSRLVITADARIDNRQELAASLGLSGEESHCPDEYLILKAYEKWGPGCAARLLGDFAFAIWDRDRSRLFCARDSMGVKPFYFYQGPIGFFFASEIKAILTFEEIPRKVNELCLLDFLLDDHQDKEITFFQGVSRLPPAQYLSVSLAKLQGGSFGSLDPAQEIYFHNDEEYAERFLELFTQSVRARLRTAVPIGAALSGGLDSSAIACVALSLLSQSGEGQLDTFSAIFSDLPQSELSRVDEGQYIEKVLSLGGFTPHYVDMGSTDPLTGITAVLQILDEPISAPTLTMFQKLYASASDQGAKVYLEGIDGDLVVSHGYERFPDLVRRFKWATWMGEVRAVSKRSGLSTAEIFKLFTLQSMVPPSIYQSMRNLRRHAGVPTQTLDYLSADFIRRQPIKNRIHTIERRKDRLPHSAKQAHFKQLVSGEVPYSLELLDKIASRCNIEVRYPFYDRRMIEYCLAVPVDQKLSAGWSRFIFRNSMGGILPEEIRWRYSKADFRPYFKGGMLRFSESLTEDVISSMLVHLEPYLDTARLHALFLRLASGAFCSIGQVEIFYRSLLLSNWLGMRAPGSNPDIFTPISKDS